MAYCSLSTSTSLGGSSSSSSSFDCSDLTSCLDVTFPGSVSIKDLTVTGSQYIEHQKHLYIGDPLIVLNSGVAGSNSHDIGWLGDRGSDINIATIWDESETQFALVSTTDDGTTIGDVTIADYESLKVKDLLSTGAVGIGTDTPVFPLHVQENDPVIYESSSTTRSTPSGIVGFSYNHDTQYGAAFHAFKDRPTASTWYIGDAGSFDDPAASNYGAPFVIGNRTDVNAYSEKVRIDKDGNVGIGTLDGGLGNLFTVSGGNMELVPDEGVATTLTLDSKRADEYMSMLQWRLRGTNAVQMGWGQVGGSQGDFQIRLLEDNDLIITGGSVGIYNPTKDDYALNIMNPTSTLTVWGDISGASGIFEEGLHISGVPVSTGGASAGSSNLGNGYSINQDLNTGDSPTFKVLTLTGSMALKDDAGVNSVVLAQDGGGDGAFSLIDGAGTTKVNLDAGGPAYILGNKLGIGTSGPTSELEVIGTISGTTVTGDSVFATHIQQQLVDSAAPSDNDVLKWNAAGAKWVADTVSSAGAATQSNLENTYVMDQSTRKTDDVIFNTISGNSGHFTGALAVGPYVPSGTVGSIVASNDIISSYSSDERLKDNITPIPDSRAKISQIAGVEFDWNEKAYSHLEGHDVGVIAQEIETVLPEAVTTRDDGYKAVKYEKIIPLLIEGLKEQDKRITLLEEKLKDD